MNLRNYQDADFPGLDEVLKASGIYCEPLDQRHTFQRKIEHDPTSMIVAVEDDKVVGTVFIIYDPWDSFVYHLGVHPNYQRRGIGSALMEEAEKRLKEEV
jgi:ribosomal protein S18 acetylase RimI-like enzyme